MRDRIVLDTTNHKLSDHDYQKWLQSLKDGDTVLLQSFWMPYRVYTFYHQHSFPFTYWRYTPFKIKGNILTNDSERCPIDRITGMSQYHKTEDNYCATVFPQRIVPIGEYLTPHQFSLNPVYEPLFTNNLEYYFTYKENYEKYFSDVLSKEFDTHYFINDRRFEQMLFVGYGSKDKGDKNRNESYWDAWIKAHNLERNLRYLYRKANTPL